MVAVVLVVVLPVALVWACVLRRPGARRLRRFGDRFGVPVGPATAALLASQIRRRRVWRALGATLGWLLAYVPVLMTQLRPEITSRFTARYLGAAPFVGYLLGTALAERSVSRPALVGTSLVGSERHRGQSHAREDIHAREDTHGGADRDAGGDTGTDADEDGDGVDDAQRDRFGTTSPGPIDAYVPRWPVRVMLGAAALAVLAAPLAFMATDPADVGSSGPRQDSLAALGVIGSAVVLSEVALRRVAGRRPIPATGEAGDGRVDEALRSDSAHRAAGVGMLLVAVSSLTVLGWAIALFSRPAGSLVGVAAFGVLAAFVSLETAPWRPATPAEA